MLSRLLFLLAAALLATLAQASETLVAHRQPIARDSIARQPRARALTLGHIHRRLAEISLDKRDKTFSNSTSLDKSFDGVTLFKLVGEASKDLGNGEKGELDQSVGATGGIEIVCARCYTKGKAVATLNLETDFNATQVLDEVQNSVSDTLDQIEEWVNGIKWDVSELELTIPSPNITFDIDLDVFPGAMIEFQFDGVEMYVELDVTLGAGLSYRLNLYKSHELGIELAADLFLGLVFSVDLLLSVDTEITITSGFHLLLDDGILLRLAMFAKKTSDINFNGGTFEFLPVTVKTTGAVLRGVIQLSLRAGFSFSTPDITPGFNIEIDDFNLDELTQASAGIEARVFANVAELSTNVTADLSDDAECALAVVQEYSFAVGAGAGATAGFGGHVWGPVAAAQTALFVTTLASACAIDGSKTTSVPAAARMMMARDPQDGDAELTTETLTRENTYTATLCASSGLADCPASLMTVEEVISTETLVTAVSSGVEATFPEATRLQVLSTVAFGTNAKSMVSETAKAGDDDDDNMDDGDEFFDKKTGGVNNKLIIGLSVGLGVPFILAIIAAIIFFQRRRSANRYDPAPITTVEHTETSYMAAVKPPGPTQEVRRIYNN